MSVSFGHVGGPSHQFCWVTILTIADDIHLLTMQCWSRIYRGQFDINASPNQVYVTNCHGHPVWVFSLATGHNDPDGLLQKLFK